MDELEALARLIATNGGRPIPGVPDAVIEQAYDIALRAAERILAAGWRKLPEPGSEEWEAMVEVALAAHWLSEAPESPIPARWYSEEREPMSAALRAALWPTAPTPKE